MYYAISASLHVNIGLRNNELLQRLETEFATESTVYILQRSSDYNSIRHFY